MQTQRLKALEKQAAHLPRSGAALLRIVEQTPEAERAQWLTTLTDAELDAFDQAANEARWAAGLPVYDLSVLTDDELERFSGAEDDVLLAKCPILPPSQSTAL
jgi:hypothetical protein